MVTALLDGLEPRAAFAAKLVPARYTKARRDALRAIARDIPDPEAFAWWLPKPYCFWLLEAWRAQDPENSGCWRVSEDRAKLLFTLGLCDRDGYLMAFGNAVRKAMIAQSA